MSRVIILLVDNDPSFLKLAQEFLEDEGYHVLSASSAEEAKRLLDHTPIGLAIIDYRLNNDDDEHDESGLQLARVCPAPVIMLTRFNEHTYVRNALRLGKSGKPAAVDFILKQEPLETLLMSVKNVLIGAKLFLSYARADALQVGQLHDNLYTAGHKPWMDTKCLVGGEKWEVAIRKAIREADFFILCLSSRSINRRGFIQKEIRQALSILEEMLEEDIYLIPVRLEDCPMVDQHLETLQWIDLFEPDGFQRLVHAIQTGMKRRV